MSKSILISIRPEHAYNIIVGKKTLELRTWIPKGYVGWVYVYVTKGKPYLIKNTSYQWLKGNITSYTLSNKTLFFEDVLNGKVVFRFWFDEYDTYGNTDLYSFTYVKRLEKLLNDTCITYQELFDYIKKVKPEDETNYIKYKPFYAWHIKKLEVFDEPKQLNEFALVSNYKHIVEKMTPHEKSMLIFGNTLKKAPQKMQWVYVKELENE